MAWGFRVPSFRKRIAARTSAKRLIRNSLGLKGCLMVILMVLVPVVLLCPGCKDQEPSNAEPSTRPSHAGTVAASAPAAQATTARPSSAATTQAAHRRIHVFISGRVQGVGFRAFTQEQAQRFEVAGFVRNLTDGRVEMVAEGPPMDINKLIAQVKHGPPSAKVDKLDCTEETPKGEFKGFSIK